MMFERCTGWRVKGRSDGKRHEVLLLTVLLLPLGAAAQGIVVTGRVVGPDQKPVRQAVVQLVGQAQGTVRADTHGCRWGVHARCRDRWIVYVAGGCCLLPAGLQGY